MDQTNPQDAPVKVMKKCPVCYFECAEKICPKCKMLTDDICLKCRRVIMDCICNMNKEGK